MNSEIGSGIKYLMENINSVKPLVHHITNYVTVNDCANITLAIGASPIMADDINEVEEIVSISSALVINIGTLNTRTVDSMILAGKMANEKNIPVVLDPVGAGASKLRNEAIEKILKGVRISVLKGNMSEILFIAGLETQTRGVDASENDMKNEKELVEIMAKKLATRLECVVAITGVIDLITDGEHIVNINNGDKMLSTITGTGCMSASLIGSFTGINNDAFLGAITGILCMGIAGEKAALKAKELGNGSFRIELINQISKLEISDLLENIKID